MRTFRVRYSIKPGCLRPYQYESLSHIDITLIYKAKSVDLLFKQITAIAVNTNWGIENIEEII